MWWCLTFPVCQLGGYGCYDSMQDDRVFLSSENTVLKGGGGGWSVSVHVSVSVCVCVCVCERERVCECVSV